MAIITVAEMVLYLSIIGSGCTGNIFLLTNMGCRLPLHLNNLSFSACADGVMKFDEAASGCTLQSTSSMHLKDMEVEDSLLLRTN